MSVCLWFGYTYWPVEESGEHLEHLGLPLADLPPVSRGGDAKCV